MQCNLERALKMTQTRALWLMVTGGDSRCTAGPQSVLWKNYAHAGVESQVKGPCELRESGKDVKRR